MDTLLDNPAFSSNEVYEIQQTDGVEGAGAGASFNGIGISNQPHQQLANRTAYLKGRQDTNIASISAIQAFDAKFAGLVAALKNGAGSGYLKIPYTDAAAGPRTLVAQWGKVSWVGLSAGEVENVAWTVDLPVPFTSFCAFAHAALTTSDFGLGRPEGALYGAALCLETGNWGTAAFQVFSDYDGGNSLWVQNGNHPYGLTGFSWIAIGV